MKEEHDPEILTDIFCTLTKIQVTNKQDISNLICAFIDFAKMNIPDIPLNTEEIKV